MTPVEVLRKARELISTPDRWTKGYFAHDLVGTDVEPHEDGAVCFCALGALGVSSYYEPVSWIDGAIELLETTIGCHDLGEWNDAPERTHVDILAAFDEAIRRAEASL
jgi:hypothetical protein